jgi:antitoxin (DNA-binding transcriptional repressor) of toxin-antitoxin stability system
MTRRASSISSTTRSRPIPTPSSCAARSPIRRRAWAEARRRTGGRVERELVDGEFVTVLLEGVQPVNCCRDSARGGAVGPAGRLRLYVDADNKAQQSRVQLGQSTPVTAVGASGLTEGQMVVSDGIQRVRPGEVVIARAGQPAARTARRHATAGKAGHDLRCLRRSAAAGDRHRHRHHDRRRAGAERIPVAQFPTSCRRR